MHQVQLFHSGDSANHFFPWRHCWDLPLECSPCVLLASHMRVNLSQTLVDVAKTWGIEKKNILAVSDNASNIKSAIASTGWKQFGFLAHTLNLIVQESIKLVHNILEKVKTIIGHFKRSSKATKMLADTQRKNGVNIPLKLILKMLVIRWNSTFHMTEMFVKLEDSLRSTIIGLLYVSLPTISGEEWTVLKELSQILEPLDDATQCCPKKL
ncbi:hypothetical protein NQ315_012513 [Exocentrus adspersus]|uniref:Zinc finger BED domain-containing protein 4 n=1 Tax=Exocentrus adspersus TaxID=1586481 RepID=A0AAV8VCM8_9CUCU|nr:hypothetical protein NQ315_012513 [Exocentrus adspersus]